jgi:hypothetical protein
LGQAKCYLHELSHFLIRAEQPLSYSFCQHFLKESIDELRDLNLGHLMPETGPCVKNWAIEQGSGPNLGHRLSQIWANLSLLRRCLGCQDLLSHELKLLSHCSVLTLVCSGLNAEMDFREVSFPLRVYRVYGRGVGINILSHVIDERMVRPKKTILLFTAYHYEVTLSCASLFNFRASIL